jgi:predicted DNA-binding transcriptional regulator AlpA
MTQTSHREDDSTDARLLRPAEVVRILGVSRSWLYLAAAEDRIPHLRLGGPSGPLRFRHEDISAWLDACRRSWMPGDSFGRTTERAARHDPRPAA